MFEPDITHPSFGYSTTPWVAPKASGTEDARSFYTAWINFSTAKDFAWRDAWDLREAPDRRIRRLMEKENKKSRDDGRRDYNDTIRQLAKFLRKRDPRYKIYQTAQANAPTAKTGSAATTRTADAAAAYVEQEWQKVGNGDTHADLEWAFAEGEDPEEWECVACGKSFRSEAAWDSHERSRKHMVQVERLRMEMEAEDEALQFEEGDLEAEEVGEVGEEAQQEIPDGELEHDVADAPPRTPSPTPSADGHAEEGPASPPPEGNEAAEEVATASGRKKKKQVKAPLERERVSKTERKRREVPDFVSGETPLQSDGEANGDGPAALTKREKRRAKQAKKTEEGETGTMQTKCNVCEETFSSKTKLFAHISLTGHALATPEAGGGKAATGVGKGKKGKKAGR